jgi:hypothetical protein
MAKAEQALVEAVRCGAKVSCAELASYQAWANAHPVIARHLASLPGVAIPCVKP